MTILDLITKTVPFLEKADIATARLDVELLLAHVLHLKRMDLYLQFERVLSEKELDGLRPLVKRRAAREPLQHLLGTVDFCGLTVACTAQALVPRPETELLAEKAISLLNGHAAATVLDVGTGSGVLALAIAQAVAGASVVATESSEEALTLARANAERNGLQTRVDFRQGDLLAPVRADERFDLIVSNPPYIPSAEIATLAPEVRHDPVVALDGGPDGLTAIRRLAAETPVYLKPGGWLMMEIGHDQANAVETLLKTDQWADIQFEKDLQGILRIAIGRR
jgi:release factor glutamine methyltransferase